MDVRQFIQTYREDWQKLENFIITINKNKREKTSEDIHEFHRTYIKVTQAFSYSQTYFPEEEVTAYLNELVAKAHNLLYQDKYLAVHSLNISSHKPLSNYSLNKEVRF